MGLSTVSQNLNLLEQEGLIERNGYFDSTGGRKAQAIRIVSDFRLSIGIGILKNMFHITVVDLYGEVINTETVPLALFQYKYVLSGSNRQDQGIYLPQPV